MYSNVINAFSGSHNEHEDMYHSTYDTSLFLRRNPPLSPTLHYPGRIRLEIPPTMLCAEIPVPVGQ